MFMVHVVPLLQGTEIMVSLGRYSIFFCSGGFNQNTIVIYESEEQGACDQWSR